MSNNRDLTDEEKIKLNIPLGAKGTFIHMDAVPPEPTTAGWTDDQIRRKSMEELDAMIKSGEQGMDSLRTTLRQEEDRVTDLRRVRQRKTDLGG